MKIINEIIEESSLSKVWRDTQKYDCGGITGYRDENTKEVNKKNNKEIMVYLKSKGYSVIKIRGNYIENFGKKGQKEVGENSFFVVDYKENGNLRKDLLKLGQRYDQDSVLFVKKGGKNAELIGTSKRDNSYPGFGKIQKVGDAKFGYHKKEFLSRVGGRVFAFESEEINMPCTRNGKWAWAALCEEIEIDMNGV